MRIEIVGFFDVNRLDHETAQHLMYRGWVPVLGDPHQAVCWRKSIFERFMAWVLRRVTRVREQGENRD